MLSFQPRRTSSSGQQKPILDLSTTSSTASAALAGLSPQDVSLIDEIINRSPPSATTFLTVFRAYNEVLQERGLDSGDDVMYYRILLKLGVVKGRNWGEKWTTVKSQMGYCAAASTEVLQRPKQHPPLMDALRSARDTESFTIHSHQDLSQASDMESETSNDHRNHAPYLREPTFNPRSDASSSNALRLRTESFHPRVSAFRPFPPVQSEPRQYHDDTYSLVSDDNPDTLSPTPPSYRAATRETQSSPSLDTLTPTVRPRPPPAIVERKKAFIDEEEAWKQIRMERDEEVADQFRDDQCVEKCWRVWLDGYRWISSTIWQVETARNNVLTRTYFQQWRWRLSAQRDAFQQVSRLAASRTLKAFWGIWIRKRQERKLSAWRNEMRVKMNLLKNKQDVKVKKDAWAKWRQMFQLRLSSQRYLHKLCSTMFTRWRYRKYIIDRMEAMGDDAIQTNELRVVTQYWEQWKTCLMSKERERQVSSLVALRLRNEAMVLWKARMHEYRRADAFNDLRILKERLRLWKASHARLVMLNLEADKCKMRAVMHVWVARERGTLLQRVRDTRLLKRTWIIWQNRQRRLNLLEDQAQAFQRRASSSVITAAMHQWYQTRATHLNAYHFAAQYYEDQLLYITVHLWRVKLRVKLRMAKQARIARQFLLLNHALNVWRRKVKRKRALKLQELKLLARTFYEWRKSTVRQQNIRSASEAIVRMTSHHVMTNAMSTWTTRVIDMKLRELQVVERRDSQLLISAFEKWKSICMRHAEDLSLMLSYRDVKREETTRRMFYRWLTAARESRYRKSAHQLARNHDVKRSLSTAWDIWLDKTRDKQLKPLEHLFRSQLEKNLLFRAFGMWNSKPNISKPASAIRFHASCLKSKHWKIWREAMPQALQARMARKRDRRNLLAMSLDKWVQTYRTKVALKAVARAKYLRLPSKPDEVFTTTSRSSARSVISHKSSRSNSPVKDETAQLRRWPSLPDSDVVTSRRRSLSSASDGVRMNEQKNLWKELRLAQRGQNGLR